MKMLPVLPKSVKRELRCAKNLPLGAPELVSATNHVGADALVRPVAKMNDAKMSDKNMSYEKRTTNDETRISV